MAVRWQWTEITACLTIQGPGNVTSGFLDEVELPRVSAIEEDVITRNADGVCMEPIPWFILCAGGVAKWQVARGVQSNMFQSAPRPENIRSRDVDFDSQTVEKIAVGRTAKGCQVGSRVVVHRNQKSTPGSDLMFMKVDGAPMLLARCICKVEIRANDILFGIGIIEKRHIAEAVADVGTGAVVAVPVRQVVGAVDALHAEVVGVIVGCWVGSRTVPYKLT